MIISGGVSASRLRFGQPPKQCNSLGPSTLLSKPESRLGLGTVMAQDEVKVLGF